MPVNLPASHEAQAASADAPVAALKVPEEQAMQSAEVLDCVFVLYVPTPHLAHESWPAVSVYWPGLQAVQNKPSPLVGLYFPASHATQLPALDTPVLTLYLPASQSTHTPAVTAPGVGPYFPAAHAMQEAAVGDPWLGLYFPASHKVKSR